MLSAFAAKLGLQAYQLSCDICCRRPSSAANPTAAIAAVDWWDRQTERHPEIYSSTSEKHTHTHNRLTALCPGLPGQRWAGTRTVKPIWISLKQETASGSGINWAICKSAPHSRQITTPAPHHSGFYRPDALPAAQPTASKHWRHSQLNRHEVQYTLLNC